MTQKQKRSLADMLYGGKGKANGPKEDWLEKHFENEKQKSTQLADMSPWAGRGQYNWNGPITKIPEYQRPDKPPQIDIFEGGQSLPLTQTGIGLDGNEHHFDVSPETTKIRIGMQSGALGLDGWRYKLDLYDLDESGNVIPESRQPASEVKEFGGNVWALGGLHEGKDDFEWKGGTGRNRRIIIQVPPQQEINQSVPFRSMKVYVPKGSKLIRIR